LLKNIECLRALKPQLHVYVKIIQKSTAVGNVLYILLAPPEEEPIAADSWRVTVYLLIERLSSVEPVKHQ